MALPTGTVTFLFTDIERSTRLLDRDVDAQRDVLLRHHDLIRAAVQRHDGVVFETVGDAVYASFPTASGAVAAALESQQAMQAEPEGHDRLLARMAVHSGEVQLRDSQHYLGEPLVRTARMLVLGHGGQTLVSGSAAAMLGTQVPAGTTLRDLGWHRLKDLERREQVFQLDHPDLPRSFPALISLESWPNNLPAQLTSFVGRERELSQLAAELSDARLLTLTGAGGAGKTRLAIELATIHGRSATHGAWFIDLAPLSDPKQIVPALVNVLGLGDSRPAMAEVALGAIVDHLRAKRTLLVFDNCEHLLDGAAAITAPLLESCPTLRIVATSREPLAIPGEKVYRVPGLDKAEALFIERARSVESDFSVDDGFLLTRICDRLDRMPLAIELAAARVRALSLPDLASRLDDRFRILTGASRTATRRQQTLRATIDWSYDLLSDDDRVLLRRCAVFTGSFELTAAEGVCGIEPLTADAVLDHLTSLVDKSLVNTATRASGTRYRMLETVREYAIERLAESGEADQMRRRHADHFRAFAEAQYPLLIGGDYQQHALDRLDDTVDNLRAALRWSTENDVAVAARFGLILSRYLNSRGHTADGDTWAAAVLGNIASVDPALRGEVMRVTSIIATNQGDFERATDLSRAALEWFQGRNDRAGVSNALRHLAYLAEQRGDAEAKAGFLEEAVTHATASGNRNIIAMAKSDFARQQWQQGNYRDARKGYEDAIRIRRDLGDRLGIAPLIQDLAYIESHAGRPERGEQLAVECVALNRELRGRRSLAVALNTLGNIRRDLGRASEATELHDEALEIASSLGDTRLVALTKLSLGEIALARSDVDRAGKLASEALRGLTQLDSFTGIEWCYDLHARVAARQGDPVRATQLMAASITARERLKLVAPPSVAAQDETAMVAMKAAVGNKRFEELWTRGAAMSRSEATAYALSNLVLTERSDS